MNQYDVTTQINASGLQAWEVEQKLQAFFQSQGWIAMGLTVK